MHISIFDFELPKERIAQSPACPRDSARLLTVGKELQDAKVTDLAALLRPGDVMVFNNTRVIPAKLEGKRGAAGIEINLHKYNQDGSWLAFARPAKRLRVGDIFQVADDFMAQVEAKHEGEVTLRFNLQGEAFSAALNRYGQVPLPPYIARSKSPSVEDNEDYQTIYAKQEGAVAAPTAGLHFTKGIFDALDARGVKRAFVTLHVGAGTFLPVKVEDIHEHKMHAEYGVIDMETAKLINETRAMGGRVVAVGTTSLRILETVADDTGLIKPFAGETSIFITPGYRFKIVDVLMTNFHLPKSTLFMLVSAFAGTECMQQAYQHAIEKQYRFFSYGDASLLYRAEGV